LSEAKQHSVGWYVGAGVFWLLCAWLITVGLSSIIPQIFHPERSHAAASGSCAQALRMLEGELLAHTSRAIARAPKPGERDALTEWLAKWDARLDAAKPNCKQAELTAWDELARLRHGMRGLVDRFDREQAPRVHKLDALVGPVPDSAAEAP
jgi:hypothetical protein